MLGNGLDSGEGQSLKSIEMGSSLALLLVSQVVLAGQAAFPSVTPFSHQQNQFNTG